MLIWFCAKGNLFAQCAATINTFPYALDFEAGSGNWTSGGVNNDWVLGAPTKPIITNAASGINCWITGGLSTSFYQFGERSFVVSPCFDFSLLDYPVVSFQIFWETENQYDGGNFQYSINGGTSWVNVGTNNEPTDCFTQNWFNQVSITNLVSLATIKRGWGGTTLPSSGSCHGGNGSGQWKLAKHCLKNLAHEPQVIFRFTFGAGTTCNDYDGLAFDDFRIEEAPNTVSSFTFNCSSSNSVSFMDGSSVCPSTWNWNFGDTSTSNQQNTSHTFSSAGVYDIKLVTGNSCSAPDTFTQQITIIDATVTSTDESCAGIGDATASVVVSPSGTYNYSWNTVPVQIGTTATNLNAGSYIVTIDGNTVCTNLQTLQVLVSPVTFSATTNTVATSCAGVTDGIAFVQTSNASLYSYSWNTAPVQTTDTAFNLATGNYTVDVNGPGLCFPVSLNVNVQEGNSGVPQSFLGSDTSTCSGNTIVIHAGNFSSYQWNDGSDSSFLLTDKPGLYSVSVVTTIGCTSSDTIFVEEKCLDDVVVPNSFTPNDDGSNDIFYGYGIEVKSFNMKIFDRWGEKIFESDSILEGWDGTYHSHHVYNCIYVWVVTYSMDGVTMKTKKGSVALIR